MSYSKSKTTRCDAPQAQEGMAYDHQEHPAFKSSVSALGCLFTATPVELLQILRTWETGVHSLLGCTEAALGLALYLRSPKPACISSQS